MAASTRIADERMRTHTVMMAVEGFLANLEFQLPIIEDALQDIDHPMAKKALEQIQERLRRLEEL